MLDLNTFKTVIQNTPLISIDFIVKNHEDKILLGKRVNKPAKDFWFTLGGKIYKNEKIKDAKRRILKEELNLNLEEQNFKFIGIFEHFYEDSFCDDSISTHYVNLAYEIRVLHMQDLPKEQHTQYKWLSINELLNSNEINKYVKDYFTSINNNIK